MTTTLYLRPETWDLTVDASHNIALASLPYAAAQTVANACRLWRGEAPYNSNRGMPYETEILGKQPPPQMLATWFETEAQTVPDVQSVVVVVQSDRTARQITGQIQCTLTDGTIINV